MLRTHSVKKSEVKPEWHLIDAKDEVLGRLSTKVAKLLTGKDKPNFSMHINIGDKIVIINAEKIKVTGNKLADKMYYRHSGFPGGFREETLGDLLGRAPEEVIRNAVWGMLPNNKLRKHRMTNLYIYKGSEHKHSAQLGK